jgi:hypothetical protein
MMIGSGWMILGFQEGTVDIFGLFNPDMVDIFGSPHMMVCFRLNMTAN